MRPTWAIIDLDAFQHNIAVASQLAGDAELVAVLKADAYGHGLERMCVAAVATGHVSKIALTSVEEAMRVRRSGVTCPLMLLEGCFEPDEILWCNNNNVELVFHSAYQFDFLASVMGVSVNQAEDLPADKPCRLWLKLNTGMNRLGFSAEEATAWLKKIRQLSNVQLVGTLMHFACADESDSVSARQQLKCYQEFLSEVDDSGLRSASNSAALVGRADAVYDSVRPGIMLYGASPMLVQTTSALKLKPVMRLLSKVIAIRDICAGEKVGYGASWYSDENKRMAVVAIGYADGYPRHASNLASVVIRGQRASVIGRVSMDMITVDVTDISDVVVGDAVELWGQSVPVEEVASLCGTISYELLTGITSRVPRLYVGGQVSDSD